jgi:hypothetical protein
MKILFILLPLVLATNLRNLQSTCGFDSNGNTLSCPDGTWCSQPDSNYPTCIQNGDTSCPNSGGLAYTCPGNWQACCPEIPNVSGCIPNQNCACCGDGTYCDEGLECCAGNGNMYCVAPGTCGVGEITSTSNQISNTIQNGADAVGAVIAGIGRR